MVRLIPIEQGGKIEWTEDAPDTCPAGHQPLLPRWSPCSICRYACRHWLCEVCSVEVRDDEHVHRS